jgi:hypothetical protein
MTTTTVDLLRTPASARDARVLAWAHAWADDQLGGRTVWRTGDDWAGVPGAPATSWLDVPAEEPLRQLPERLMTAPAPDPADDELCGTAVAAGDALVASVRTGDVVVLQDLLSALVAQAVRERDAHAVWLSDTWPVPAPAWEMLRRHATALDALVIAWPAQRALIAIMPSTNAVTARAEWSTLLGEVVDGDRAQHVGGRLHVRPFVAAR